MRERNSASVLLAFSIILAVLLFLSAAACGITGLIQVSSAASLEGATSIFLFVLGTLWSVLLLVPTIWYAIRHLRGRLDAAGPFSAGWSAWLPYVLMALVYPLLLLAGSQAARSNQLAWWVIPLLQIPAATLPVFWLSSMALRRLSPVSRLQRWGVFGMGLTLGPGLILVVELGVIFFLVLAFIFRIGTDESQAFELMVLAQRLQYAEPNPDIILSFLEPYLLQPVSILGIFGFVAILVPLVEETLKPIGIWLLARHRLNPAQGFAVGALSGAGYALFENLFITAPGEQWALISIGRIGTTTMHIFTAGLTGYALADAWGRGRYLRLAAIFAAVVFIHALWNGLLLINVAGTIPALRDSSTLLANASQVGAVVLLGLYFLLFLGLITANRLLRRYAIIPPLEPPTPALVAAESDLPEGEPGPGPSSL